VYEAVEAAFAKAGRPPAWPVSIVVEQMPIMGATQSRPKEGHLIHVSLRAARGEMFEGLIAHEMGHIARTEAGHPSHNRLVHERAIARVTVPRGFSRGFPRLARSAIGHVEDIYADDYAIPLAIGERSREFFAEWVHSAMAMAGGPWDDVFGLLDIAFSIGNLERHGLLEAPDPLNQEAREFARSRGLRSLDAQTALYRDLPDPVTDPECEDILVDLLRTALDELRKRPA
jgi:hypothetical protein